MTEDLLPKSATSQERSISLSVNRAPGIPTKTLWSPAVCPEAMLPWLAWALSVDEWRADWGVAQKRAVIAASVDHHRKKGTLGALRRALQSLGYEVEIDERTGAAYTFRLLYKISGGTAGGAVMDSTVDEAQVIALRQKNARSELEGSMYISIAPGPGGPFFASITISGSETDCTEFTGPDAPRSLVISGITNPVDANGTFWEVATIIPGTFGLPHWTDGTYKIGLVDTGVDGPWIPGESSFVWCIYTPGADFSSPATIHFRQVGYSNSVDLLDVVWQAVGPATGTPILTLAP